MALTKEQIWTTADELQAQGKAASLRAVRKALGDRGSFDTISEALTERKRNQEEQAALAEALPHALEQRLAALGRQVWAAALGSAGERLNADRQQFDHAKAHLESERNEAFEVANHATTELEASHARSQHLERENTGLRGSVEELQAKLADSSQRLAAATAQGAESAQRIADLNRELERLHQTSATLVERLAARSAPQEMPRSSGRDTSSARRNGESRS